MHIANESNQKKLMSIFVVLMMVLSFLTPLNVSAATETNGVTIQILATSDLHGRFLPYDYAVNSENTEGSLAQISTAVKKLRAENKNTILVDAGDAIQDNSSALFIKDKINPMMLAMNEIGYDVFTLGNHEFNYGVPTLQSIISQFKGKVLAGNVYDNAGKRVAAPYTIVERDGVKVGIIGMVTPNIKRWDSVNLKDYKVTNPVEETKKAINEIKDKADIIIAVEHMGEDGEYGEAGSGVVEVAEACPELAAIVCGHAHSEISGDYYYNGKIYRDKDVTSEVKNKGVLIVEPGKWGQVLSQINIKVTKKDGKFVVENKSDDISSAMYDMAGKYGKPLNYEVDSNLKNKLEAYNKRAIDDANVVIGELKGGDLVPQDEIKGIPTAQIKETAMIDLINNVQMHYGKTVSGHEIDVAAAAAFRSDANIKEGKIKKCDISLIYKYDNSLYVLKVTGKQLKKYMEWSASYYNQYKDGDLTISFNPEIRGYNYDMFSGVNYNIDISKPAGERIVDLTKDGKTINDDDVLYMAVNDYRAKSQLLKAGPIFKEGEALPELVEKSDNPALGLGDGRIRDLIGKYITEVKEGAITPETNNNWKVVGNDWNGYKRAIAAELINSGKLQLPTSEDGRTPNVKSITTKDVEGYDLTTIVHTNDTHSRVEAGQYDGMGFAKIATKVNNLRENNKNLLVLDAGDTFHGQTIASISKGESIVKIMNKIKYDAMAPGNHDFNYGQERLLELSKIANFPILAANLVKKDGSTVLKPYIIKEINGQKVGIFGLATPETAYKTNPKNVEGLTFENPIEVSKKMVSELKDKTDMIIAISHLGLNEKSEFTSKKVAEKVDGIDIIVDGHSHTVLENGLKVNNTLIVQTGEYDKNLGIVNILYKDGKLDGIRATLLPKSEGALLEDNKEIVDEVSAIKKENEKTTSVEVGSTSILLDGEREHVRAGETNLGDIITNAMMEATGADASLTNGGGIRASIKPGKITKGDIITVLPFGNYVILKEVKGANIIKALENGISSYPELKGGFPHVAGITYTFDPNQKVGGKIVEAKIGGKLIDPNKTYKLATNDFMSAGGDGYTMLKEGKVLGEYPGLDEIVINYVQKNGIETAKLGGRIKVGKAVEVVKPTEQVKPVTKPAAKPVVQPAKPTVKTYVVKAGDTLSAIAQKFGKTWQKLAEFNKIKNPNLIFPNEKILIPAN